VIQRFLLAALSCLLLELAASAAAGLFAPGTESLLMVGCALGLLLAATWYGRASWLAAVAALVTVGWAALAAHVWTASRGGGTAMLFLHQTPVQPVDGTAMFVLAATCTGLAALSGWMLFHAREPWPVAALLGSCILLRADVSADFAQRFPIFAFGILCLVAISLAGRARIGGRLAIASLLAALAIAVAWQLPTSIPTWSQSFVDPIRGLAAHTVPVSGQTALDLTGSFHPSNREVMSISLDRRVAHPYWWTGVFDRYDGQSWQMTGYQIRRVPPGRPILPPPSGAPESVLAGIHVSERTSALVFPGSPASASVPALVLTHPFDGQPLQVLASQSLNAGEIYQTRGVVTAPAAGSALAAPAPGNAYLQLPRVPSRVRSLALAVARHGSTVDQVLRIRDYLISGRFTYSTATGSLPGHDAADYFLFESHAGYCNQFATTMAVLLREVGIPSRLVTGFVTGTFESDRYLVREKDAHSWVEAYLPNRGWVDFEPTPGFALDPQMTVRGSGRPATQPRRVTRPIVSPPVAAPTPAPVARVPVTAPVPRHAGTDRSPLWIALGVALLVVLLIIVLRRPRSARAVYARMARSPFVSRRPRTGETPNEFSERAFRRPAARAQARIITELYVRERYGGRPPEAAAARAARHAWRILRLRRAAPWIRP
jgi:transglutaminase-like putative cysteine protease